MAKALCGLLLTCAVLPALARGEEIARPWRSTLMLGSGGAGMGAVEGYEALMHNPANLSTMPDELVEVPILTLQSTYSDDFMSVVKDQKKVKELEKKPVDFARYLQGKDLHFGMQNFSGAAFSQHAVGLVEEAHVNFSLTNNPVTFLPDVTALADIYMGLLYGYGMKAPWLGEGFSVGGNVKVLQKQQMVVDLEGSYLLEQQSNNQKLKLDSALTKFKGVGIGSDVALNWQPGVNFDPKVSFVVRNIGSMAYTGGDKAPALDKQTLNLGFTGGVLLVDSAHYLQAMADFEDLLNAYHSNFYRRVHLGTRYTFLKCAGITLGLNQGYPTYGFFAGYKFAFLEYSSFTEERGDRPGDMPSKRESFKLKLGWWL